MAITIVQRKVDEVFIIDITGRICLYDGVESFKCLINTLAQQKISRVILNLAETSYVDSSGLGELVSGFTTLANQGGLLKLLNPTPRVRGVLLCTNMNRVFAIFDDEEMAVKSFR